MRIQCDQCNARYAISDDKIRGADRVFKIRCKQCSSIITIHGIDESGAAAPAQEAATPVWYYVLDGEQVGPVTAQGLKEEVAAGTISSETYVWQAGMADWLPMNQVDELAAVAAATASVDVTDEITADLGDEAAADADLADDTVEGDALPPMGEDDLPDRTLEAPSPWATEDADDDPNAALAAAVAATIMDPVDAAEAPADDNEEADMTIADAAIPPELLEDEEVPTDAATANEAEVDAAAADEVEDEPTVETTPDPAPVLETDATLGDLFGNADEPPGPDEDYGSDDDLAGLGGEQGGGGEEGEMVWQRHDNSVLFSLNELEDEEEAPKKSDEKQAALAALTADSGLIDIRSFSKKKKEGKRNNADLFADLAGDSPLPGPMPGKESSAQAASMGAAPALPVIQRRKKSSAGLIVGGLIGAVVVAGGTAFAVMHFMKQDAPDPGPKAPAAAASDTADKQPTVAAAGTPGGAAKAGPDKATPGQPTAAPGTQPGGQPATQPGAQPGTQPAAQPGTQPGTQPAVQPAQPGAEPTAQPGTQPAAQPGTEPGAQPGAAAPGQPAADGDGQPVEAEPAATAEPEKPKKPAKPLTAKEKERLRKLREERKRKRAEREAAARAAAASKPKSEPAAKPAKPKTNANDLLANLAKAKPAEKKPAAKPATASDADLPNAPTNLQVKRVMKRANAKVRRCVTNSGQSNVHVGTSFQIKPSGGVSGVSIKGPVASSSAAGCVKSAIAGLRFPASKNGKRVNYPFFVK